MREPAASDWTKSPEFDDMDGRRVWLRVLEAVQELTSKDLPGEGAVVH